MAAATRSMAPAVASATAVMAAASPWAWLMAACFSPSERAIKASRSPVPMFIFSLGPGNEGRALAGGDVDLLLAATFGGGNQGTFLALGRDLLLHGMQDFLRRRQVLDLVTQHLDAPVQRGFVDSLD